MMHLVRRVSTRPAKLLPPPVLNSSAKNFGTTTTEVTAEKNHIEIPNRIPRSSTDILRALASTVPRDPTAAHYKYHDDPYLIPLSNVAKRTFALAHESGRKAAKWIKEEHGDLFQNSEAQPPIKAFVPKLVFTEESEVDATTLHDLIMQSEVSDAVFVYNLMKEKNIEVGQELKQSLFELVCFYNNEEPMSEEFLEERWFKQNNMGRDSKRLTWKKGEFADQLFAEIEPKTPSSYAALIRGMAKYYQVEPAFALLQEATEKQIQLDTNTFNSVIATAGLLKETADQRWELCQYLLQQMAHQQLRPNLGTMNALLECISTFANYKFARTSALKVLGEFKRIGIEPSLGTYYYVLTIFCRDRAPVSHVIVDVLRELEGKELQIADIEDTFFFTTAMEVCRNHLHDKALARKVHALLNTGNNYNMIGDTYKESIYYRNYFALLCQTEPLEEFMQMYDLLVPNIYIPEPGIMEEVLKAVEMNAAVELLPRLWSDIVVFNHTNRESLLNRTLNIMIRNRPEADNPTHSNLPEQFAKVALDIYTKVQEQKDTHVKKLAFTGQMIGDILTLLVRGGEFEKAVEVFEHIDRSQHLIPGTPSEECMSEFVDACIVNKEPSLAISCLQYCAENNMECLQLAKKIHVGFTLNEVHLSRMKSLVGDKFLKED